MVVRGKRRAAALFAAAGCAAASVYYVLPRGGTAQAVVFVGLGFASAFAILAGVLLRRPARPWPWLLFAVGNALFASGDFVGRVLPSASVPSTADVLYLSGYPLLAGGLAALVVWAGGAERRAALADTGIVTLSFAVAQWVWVMGPAIRSGGSNLAHATVLGLYPAMDVVLLAGFAGFFVTPAWKTSAFRLLGAGTVLLLVGDEIYGVTTQTYARGGPVDAAWMLSYVLWGAAALHPSMRALGEARASEEPGVSTSRIALLAVALLVVPVALVAQHARGKPLDVYEIAGLAAALSLLVVARLTGILRALERLRRRESEARRQLAAQNERLLEADRLKDEFVALVSHDLRTPLTSIIGYLELAADEPLAGDVRSHLDVAARNAQRLVRLVEDLLFVARVQAGRLDLDAAAVDLRELAQLAVEEAEPRARAKAIELELDAAPAVAEVDRGRISQVLDNLLSNALKFTPEGGSVAVRVAPHGDGAVVEVSDTGIGLGADAERVFERFFRTRAATEGRIPGTGLGLSIVRAIVEAHGGVVEARARERGGTTFRIELPARLPSGEPEPRAAVGV
ncbi:MAG TPA: HAMP domain-containing sensor histidine kinase [Gaiellaceae bacterium]|nr:HAMP domain-containing sensor histidine kinase [Gaiellaceae bacterium]